MTELIITLAAYERERERGGEGFLPRLRAIRHRTDQRMVHVHNTRHTHACTRLPLSLSLSLSLLLRPSSRGCAHHRTCLIRSSWRTARSGRPSVPLSSHRRHLGPELLSGPNQAAKPATCVPSKKSRGSRVRSPSHSAQRVGRGGWPAESRPINSR